MVALAAVFPQWLSGPQTQKTATSRSRASHDDTAARSASSHDATPDELLRQLHDNKLSAEQIAAATAQVLRLQADEKTAWEPRWGEFVACAHQREKLPDDLWNKYLLSAVQLEVKVAAETKRAEGLAVCYQFKSFRGGPVRSRRRNPRLARAGLLGRQARPLSRHRLSRRLRRPEGVGRLRMDGETDRSRVCVA